MAEKDGDMVRALEIVEVGSLLLNGLNQCCDAAVQSLELIPLKGDVETCVMKYESLHADVHDIYARPP